MGPAPTVHNKLTGTVGGTGYRLKRDLNPQNLAP